MLKYGEVTSLNEDTNRESREIELHGILQKRNRKGFYQNRYFRTSGVLLSYYKDQESFNKTPLYPNASFKFTDMTSAQTNGPDGKFIVSFAISSVVLDLKAVTESHAIHWVSFIRAKINLYAVNLLLTMDNSLTVLGSPNLLFVTTTFRELMLLKLSDQDAWNETNINCHFEAIFANRAASKISRDELCFLLLSASLKALDDFTHSCEECEVEFRTRNPRVIAHCREYMRRYAKLFCGRVILELSSVMGPGQDTNALSLQSALEIICFLQRIYLLNRFSFLPSAELSAVFDNLRSLDYMCESCICICHSKFRTWLCGVAQLQPRLQGQILVDVPMEIKSNLAVLRSYKSKFQQNTYSALLDGSMSRMLSELREFLVTFKFDDFSDEALADHIVACYKIDQYAAELCISWAPQKLSAVSSMSVSSVLLNSDLKSNVEISPTMRLLEISDACRRNAMRSAAVCVRKMLPAIQELLSLFFHETNTSSCEGWIGGRACKALLLRLGSWIEAMRNCVPAEYLVLVKAEAYRFVVVLYYSTFIGFYKQNKKAQLSAEGVAQVTMDLRLIEMWIAETGVCIECEPLKEIIKKMRLFLTCEATDLLVCFSGSVQDFASSYPHYAYDLFRVAMKLRDDIPSDYRHRVLGMCTEYITQFKHVYEKTYGISVESKEDEACLSGSDYFASRMSGESISAELMPAIGIEHCTGKKWSLVKPPHMSAEENIFITNLVTEACHRIRMIRLSKRSSISISICREKQKSSPSCVQVWAGVGYTEFKSDDGNVLPGNVPGITKDKCTNPFEEEAADMCENATSGPSHEVESSNPFQIESSNPLVSDEEGYQARNTVESGVYTPQIVVPSAPPEMDSADFDEDLDTNDSANINPHRFREHGERDAYSIRPLKMDNVSYEGVKPIVNIDAIQNLASHRMLDRSQVIFLHQDNFKDLHASLKPNRLEVSPYTGPPLRSVTENCGELDFQDADNLAVRTADDIILESTDSTVEDKYDAQTNHAPFSDGATRSALIATYSAEYLLVTSDRENFEREVVTQQATFVDGNSCEITNEPKYQDVIGRPVSVCRLESAALFIVPPDGLPQRESVVDSAGQSSYITEVKVCGNMDTRLTVNSSFSETETNTGRSAETTLYVVIYGPGTVIRRDISIDSEKVCAVPVARVIDIFENTAMYSSEGVVRVRARYHGMVGWTSFNTRDGTTIIERCVPAPDKPLYITPPPKPPKRRSIPAADANEVTSECALSNEESVSAGSSRKPPPKPPRKSIVVAALPHTVVEPLSDTEASSNTTATTSESMMAQSRIMSIPTSESTPDLNENDHYRGADINCVLSAVMYHVQSPVNSMAAATSDTCLYQPSPGFDPNYTLAESRESAGEADIGVGDTTVFSSDTIEGSNMEMASEFKAEPAITEILRSCDDNLKCIEGNLQDDKSQDSPRYSSEDCEVMVMTNVERVAESHLSILDIEANSSCLVLSEALPGGDITANISPDISEDNPLQKNSEPKMKPAKPPKKSSNLAHTTTIESSQGSPTRKEKPTKPPKINPSVPVALLCSADESTVGASVAVAVAVSMPPVLEVIDPSVARSSRHETFWREGPQRLNRGDSFNKEEEKTNNRPYNPFDSESEDDSLPRAAPDLVGSSTRNSSEQITRHPLESDHKSDEKPQRRESKLSDRISSMLHFGRRHSFSEAGTTSSISTSQNTNTNTFCAVDLDNHNSVNDESTDNNFCPESSMANDSESPLEARRNPRHDAT